MLKDSTRFKMTFFALKTSTAMDNKNSNNFVSYVGLEEHEMQQINSSRRNSASENSIKLLRGEVLLAEAQNVLMYSPVGDLKTGTSGILSVTNFKLTFIIPDDSIGEDIAYQHNHLYGYTDTCLSNIDEIYTIIGDKKRKLLPGANVSSKVKGVFITCKNLRTWSFSFKFSPLGHARNVLNTLLHHAYPTGHHLLFAYEYREPYYSSLDKGVQLFHNISDWQRELERTINKSRSKVGWRLSLVNKNYQLSSSSSEYIIVPASVTDSQLAEAVRYFQGSRPPIWSWSNDKGAALVKMPELLANAAERTQENIMLENIRKSHPQKIAPIVLELSKDISVKSIAAGFSKFVNLCSPENVGQFWLQDNNFYSLLDGTKWLKYVSYCIQKAVEAAEHLNSGYTVILQEGAGRDICCVISSLTQLILDSHFRTLNGFQSLVQKEWVAAGHPFCDRLGHIVKTDSERSPIFLLYLDCVWQLTQQFPMEFQFTETYLTTLWDSVHVSIFDTFLFNCERDRTLAPTDPTTPLTLRTVWDWGEQFNDQDILLFYNPFYKPDRKDAKDRSTMKPLSGIPFLEFWSQCYFRWIPPLEIQNGGQNHVELHARLLQNDINKLKISISDNCRSPVEKTSTCLVQLNINSFYPFSNRKSGSVISTPIMNNSILATESLLDAQSLLTAPD